MISLKLPMAGAMRAEQLGPSPARRFAPAPLDPTVPPSETALSQLVVSPPLSCALELDQSAGWRVRAFSAIDLDLSARIPARAMDNGRTLSVQGSVVVVVDDDPAVRNSLKFSLELEGFAVRVFSGGVEFLKANMPDCACLVIDQNMPGMTGLEVLKRLRDRQVSVPAILITSHPNAALRKRAAGSGISIVEKPLLGDALFSTIRAVLAQQPSRPLG